MTNVNPGYTREEIRQFVHEFYLQPYEAMRAWHEAQQVPVWRLQHCRKLVYAGELDRNLVPVDQGAGPRKRNLSLD